MVGSFVWWCTLPPIGAACMPSGAELESCSSSDGASQAPPDRFGAGLTRAPSCSSSRSFVELAAASHSDSRAAHVGRETPSSTIVPLGVTRLRTRWGHDDEDADLSVAGSWRWVIEPLGSEVFEAGAHGVVALRADEHGVVDRVEMARRAVGEAVERASEYARRHHGGTRAVYAETEKYARHWGDTIMFPTWPRRNGSGAVPTNTPVSPYTSW
jgi:hypothetical protein